MKVVLERTAAGAGAERMSPPQIQDSSSGNGGRGGSAARCGAAGPFWSAGGLHHGLLLRPRNPGLMSECIILPEYIAGDHPITSLMVQNHLALVVITIGNGSAEPRVWWTLRVVKLTKC